MGFSAAELHELQARYLLVGPRIRAAIRQRARGRFGAEATAELVAEAIALGWKRWLSAASAGRHPWVFAWAFADRVARAVFIGRRLAGGARAREPMERLRPPAARPSGGRLLLTDALAPADGPGPADQAAARIDVPAWFDSLPSRLGRVVEILATGATTNAAAAELGVTKSRVSQCRREALESWQDFHGPEVFP